MMALPQEARVWCNLCSSTIGNDRFKCSYCMIDQGLTCPDWDCCLSCEPSASTQHPGHKLLRILPDNLVPKSPYPDQWHMHPNVHCDQCSNAIVGPRFKCTLCEDFDLCASCEADPHALHQTRYGLSHLFVKIPRPLDPHAWARTIFGHAALGHERHTSPSVPPSTTAATSGDRDTEENTSASNDELVPQVEEPETSLIVVEESDADDMPPLPEDPFSGTGSPPFDFMSGMRAAAQLVGIGRDALSHPYVQQAAPPLKHVAAFMSALRTPSEGKSMPSIDVAQFGRATEQLINSIISSKRSETPSQDEVEQMLSQTFMASAGEDTNGDTLSDPTEKYDEPAMKSAEKVPDSIHSTPWEEALATNFQQLLQEQASPQDS